MTLAYWITIGVTVAVVIACVILHYEGLRLLTDRLPLANPPHRRRIVMLILSLLLLHMIEIWIFGTTYYVLGRFEGFGSLSGEDTGSLFGTMYFSATVFSTLGFGDIVPSGPIRFLTGTEAVAGLTLITWSASYIFVETLKTWTRDDSAADRE